MIKDSINWNDEFKNAMNKYCSCLFIDANLIHYKDRIFQPTDKICWIDITDYIRTDNCVGTLDKVKFCLAWLNTFLVDGDNISFYGVVHIDDRDFDFMHHTDFTSYLQLKGIITQQEHNDINWEWVDVTEGVPFYDLK